MRHSSLVNIPLLALGSIAALGVGIVLAAPPEGPSAAVTGAAATGIGMAASGLLASAVLLAATAWRATARAGTSLDPLTRGLGRAPVFVIAGLVGAAIVARLAALV